MSDDPKSKALEAAKAEAAKADSTVTLKPLSPAQLAAQNAAAKRAAQRTAPAVETPQPQADAAQPPVEPADTTPAERVAEVLADEASEKATETSPTPPKMDVDGEKAVDVEETFPPSVEPATSEVLEDVVKLDRVEAAESTTKPVSGYMSYKLRCNR